MMDACYVGDVRDGLRAYIAAGVRAQTCVTSPPYWGLRDYGTAQWEGGDTDCDHSPEARGGRFASPVSTKQASNAGSGTASRRECDCGAARVDRQIGLEPTFTEYVQTMVDVFRLVRDVLADDGTLWLNLGDSYATRAGSVGEAPGGGKQGESWKMRGKMTAPNRMPQPSLKPKDLTGIPWRVAFALQADGWYLRSDIIWHKPNPMPESVTDRPTKAHEYLFLLAKSERYFYDADAIAEPVTLSTIERVSQPTIDEQAGSYRQPGKTNGPMRAVVKSGNKERKLGDERGRPDSHLGGSIPWEGSTRNRRTVWTIGTEPYSDAHFAVMPTALVEPCVLAGSRVGDIVLDPFMGSGTVAQVAQSLGRRWIGCELNPAYAQMVSRRAAQQGIEFA